MFETLEGRQLYAGGTIAVIQAALKHAHGHVPQVVASNLPVDSGLSKVQSVPDAAPPVDLSNAAPLYSVTPADPATIPHPKTVPGYFGGRSVPIYVDEATNTLTLTPPADAVATGELTASGVVDAAPPVDLSNAAPVVFAGPDTGRPLVIPQ